MKIASIIGNKGDFVATITPDSTVGSLLQLLAEHRIGAAVVSSDGKKIAGMASERDIVRSLNDSGAECVNRAVSDIMTSVVATCTMDSDVDQLAAQMTEERVRHIPVLDENDDLVGIVSIGDIVKARIDSLEFDNKNLVNYVQDSRFVTPGR